MRYDELNGDQEEPFVIDMITWPNCTTLLRYLEKKLGIKVLSKSSWLPSGDYFAEFEYRGFEFEIQTPLSTPWLVAKKGCPREVFGEILNQLDRYRGWMPFGGYAFFKYLRLPSYRGNCYKSARQEY